MACHRRVTAPHGSRPASRGTSSSPPHRTSHWERRRSPKSQGYLGGNSPGFMGFYGGKIPWHLVGDILYTYPSEKSWSESQLGNWENRPIGEIIARNGRFYGRVIESYHVFASATRFLLMISSKRWIRPQFMQSL